MAEIQGSMALHFWKILTYATITQEGSPLAEEIKKDEKKNTCVNTVLENSSIAKIIDVNKFSDVSKIFRVIAFFKIYKQRAEKN